MTLLILYRIPSGDFILLPDPAHPVAPLVHVQGAHPAKGGQLYFVDVREEQASELDKLFPWLHPHATLLPESDLVPQGTTSAAVVAAEFREMAQSQQTAAAVALRRLGYHVVIHRDGVLVNVVDFNVPAAHSLEPADVIVDVNRTPTPTVSKLRGILAHVKPGATVTLRVRRGTKLVTLHIKTVDVGGRALIGFEPAQAARIKLPIRVAINAGGIGGPSAGLAFALEVMQQLGHNVVHGHRVAATGEIALDGAVLPIGGVKQKTYGVREAGADVFLVPAGGNARTARRYAGPVRIIAVRSLGQALHALATLPRER